MAWPSPVGDDWARLCTCVRHRFRAREAHPAFRTGARRRGQRFSKMDDSDGEAPICVRGKPPRVPDDDSDGDEVAAGKGWSGGSNELSDIEKGGSGASGPAGRLPKSGRSEKGTGPVDDASENGSDEETSSSPDSHLHPLAYADCDLDQHPLPPPGTPIHYGYLGTTDELPMITFRKKLIEVRGSLVCMPSCGRPKSQCVLFQPVVPLPRLAHKLRRQGSCDVLVRVLPCVLCGLWPRLAAPLREGVVQARHRLRQPAQPFVQLVRTPRRPATARLRAPGVVRRLGPEQQKDPPGARLRAGEAAQRPLFRRLRERAPLLRGEHGCLRVLQRIRQGPRRRPRSLVLQAGVPHLVRHRREGAPPHVQAWLRPNHFAGARIGRPLRRQPVPPVAAEGGHVPGQRQELAAACAPVPGARLRRGRVCGRRRRGGGVGGRGGGGGTVRGSRDELGWMMRSRRFQISPPFHFCHLYI
ncbi:hypothetical protein DFJ74DRAFT_669330 [Hyaloraphidium curvatum]|nr:hypothetical protein DFJ74DRAFT_669330 [Hyaloraphidium curvatum]